jgi:hypothetical protein
MLNRLEYQRLRRQGMAAKWAFHSAKVLAQWQNLGGEDVRLRVEPDEGISFDNLEGDCFNPVVNSDIPASKVAREQKEFRQRVNDEGVWFVVGEYRDAFGRWRSADSCGGFVGDDWRDSGYDTDIMEATIRAFLGDYSECLA